MNVRGQLRLMRKWVVTFNIKMLYSDQLFLVNSVRNIFRKIGVDPDSSPETVAPPDSQVRRPKSLPVLLHHGNKF